MAGLVVNHSARLYFYRRPAGRVACSVRRTGGRRSNRCSDWRLVTATSVRAHSGRRLGAGHRARRPGARAQPGAPDAYAPIWLLPRIVRTCHAPSPKLSARTTATPPGPRRQPTHLSPKKLRSPEALISRLGAGAVDLRGATILDYSSFLTEMSNWTCVGHFI